MRLIEPVEAIMLVAFVSLLWCIALSGLVVFIMFGVVG